MRRTNASIDQSPGGSRPPLRPAPQRSKAADVAVRLVRTIITVSLFIAVCKATHFRQKVLYDVRINRNFLKMFYLSSASCIACYAIMLFRNKVLRRPNQRIGVERWDVETPKAFYGMTISLVLMVVCFIFAMWRTFQLMTFVIGMLGLLSVLFVLQWVPF